MKTGKRNSRDWASLGPYRQSFHSYFSESQNNWQFISSLLLRDEILMFRQALLVEMSRMKLYRLEPSPGNSLTMRRHKERALHGLSPFLCQQITWESLRWTAGQWRTGLRTYMLSYHMFKFYWNRKRTLGVKTLNICGQRTTCLCVYNRRGPWKKCSRWTHSQGLKDLKIC